ncbi:alpha/beta fold hydrolase [Marinobacteraceae bacterium S3BR75-40.1]
MTDNNKATYGDVPVEHHLAEGRWGADLAITHVQGNAGGTPVILLHGSYSNRHFWLSPKGKGLAAYLSRQGFDVWIPEFRGHGLSTKGASLQNFSAEQQIRFDIPAFADYVSEQTGQAAHWIGHSFGGLFLYGALAKGWLPLHRVLSVATLGSQITQGDRYLKVPLVPWAVTRVTRMLGRFPAKTLGLGPENEAPKTIEEVMNWKKLGGQWQAQDGSSYWQGFSRITCPCLVIASAGDKTDPAEGCEYLYRMLPKGGNRFVLLGKEQGYARDYSHVGMVVDKAAQEEVWPLLLDWLEQQAPPLVSINSA